MKSIKKLFLFLFIISIGFGGLSYAQPKIPKENIPSDISSNVRKQIERLYSSDPQEQAKAAYQLGKMGAKAAPAVPFLIAMFDKEKKDIIVDWPDSFFGEAWLGDIVIWALFRIGKPAVEPLIIALKDKDPYERWAAVATLEEIGDKRAIEPLLQALDDEDYIVRSSSAEALARMGESRAVQPLIMMFRKDKNFNNRRSAAEALFKIDKKLAVETFIKALSNEDSTSREIAASLLQQKLYYKKIGDEQVIEPLITTFIDALKDENRDVRKDAALALGDIGDNRAIEPLIKVLKDEYWPVRRDAAEALAKIGDNRTVAPLIAVLGDNEPSVRKFAAAALKKITGRDYGEDIGKWQEWWEKNKHNFNKN